KIRDRVGDFLIDGRNAVLRRAHPDIAVLAASAPAAAPAAATTASALAIAVIGPGGARRLQLLVAEIGVHVALNRPFRGNALVLRASPVRRRLIMREMRPGSWPFAFHRPWRAQTFLARLAAPATPSPPPSPPAARFAVLGTPLGCLPGLSEVGAVRVDDLLVLALFWFDLFERLLELRGILDDDRDGGRLCGDGPRLLKGVRLLALLDDERQLAADRVIGRDRYGDLEAVLQVIEMGALVIEHIKRDLGAGPADNVVRGAALERFLDHPQELQRDRRDRAHVAGAAAMGAFVGRTLEHAGADTLTRHFQKAEVGDAADLDAGAIVLEAILEPPLDRPVVAFFIHIDEIDDDQPGEVAQAELAGDLLGGLEVGLKRRVLDVVLAGRAPRIDVDRHQRLGLVAHDIAPGPQLPRRPE